MDTLVNQLARFTAENTSIESLPQDVIHETKRVVLDSLGCAAAAVGEAGANAGIEHGKCLGGGMPDATILGTGERVSVFGAAFANAELINALDFDAVLPPGHVAPYVVPGALAYAEKLEASGAQLISAVASALEISNRLGKAMTYQRDMKDGKPDTPDVLGYSVTVFGAAAAIARVQGFNAELTANALGIAGSICPVNAQRAWIEHAPSTSIKYVMPGQIAQSAMTAVSMAELGHTGDRLMLDDAKYGFPKFIGSGRWASENVGTGLGKTWRFPAENTIKPYPHCRVMHSLFDALLEIVETHDIRPEEIEELTAWGEAWVFLPVWENSEVSTVRDAQFSMAHGLAVAAHRVTPGKGWADLELIQSDSVAHLMNRTTVLPHPEWGGALKSNPAARPARIELKARGQIFAAERTYPKGSPSPDPQTYFTDQQLADKFLHNVDGVLDNSTAQGVVERVMNLENEDNAAAVLRLMAANVAGARVG